MSNQHGRTDGETARQTLAVPWDRLERHAGSALTTGGAALVASVVVPVGLEPVTEWDWAAGIVLVGFAVLGFAAGLLGLYPTSKSAAPRLSSLGAVSAVVAGTAALGLIAMSALAVAAATVGVDLGKPMRIFAAVALSMGLGLATGLLAFGIALWTTEATNDVTSALLVGAGTLLFVPVGSELLRIVLGVAPPAWLLFPVLVGLSLLALVVGYSLRRRDTARLGGTQ